VGDETPYYADRFVIRQLHFDGITSDFVESPKIAAGMKLTPADQQLLSLLRENARAPTAELARRLGLSRTTVQSRIERLERQGVITGYTVRVSDEAERGGVRAHIMVTVLPRQMPAVVRALHAMPEVRALHSVSGPFDLVALALVPTVAEMDELTDRIGAVDGVERTTSSIVLSAKFER
jgi:DNA-binding Lrp family transcriptional regulator